MIHIVDEDGSTLKNSCWRDLGVAIISAPSNWGVLGIYPQESRVDWLST